MNAALPRLNRVARSVDGMRRTLIALISMLLAACSGAAGGALDTEAEPPAATDQAGTEAAGSANGGGMVDPRAHGLDVALGEWALTLESAAIRPGRVTFVVTNRGTMAHGFEIESEGGDDSSGSSGGDGGIKAETELLRPGDTTRLTLELPAGLYKVECLVDGHDDLGMEALLEVRRDAPLLEPHPVPADAASVSIASFAFDPDALELAAGSRVTWTNDDPTPHTVTAEDGAFDSGAIDPGAAFSVRIDGDGSVAYRCMIHPDMVGTITVA
jgi:plastocyanin